MNRSLTPIVELDRRLVELFDNVNSFPPIKKSKKPTYEKSAKLGVFNGLLSAFDDQLEGLRLEASLLQSEDSPFTQRRRLREDERAKRLAEARALAEAQFERLSREKELEELKAQRLAAKAKAEALYKSSNDENNSSALDEDWDPSIEYTLHHTFETNNVSRLDDDAFDGQLTISPDDSIFADLPSQPPLEGQNNQESLTPLEELKRSIPPKKEEQVTIPPMAKPLPTNGIVPKQLISLLKGILPAVPRYQGALQNYIGSGWTHSEVISKLPWDESYEIKWQELNTEQIEIELDGLTSLSLAPRAFSPASPASQRTISLKLQSKNTLEQPKIEDPEDEFNLVDFDEQKDPELYQMHETYRALEEQVAELSSRDKQLDELLAQPEPSFDYPTIDPSLDEPLEVKDFSEADAFDEGPDYATLDPDLPSIADPFDVLEDLSFDAERLTSDFDWEGDTPTNVFGDEPTPTNVFGDDSRPGEVQDDHDDSLSQGNNRGLFSRFFGRSK